METKYEPANITNATIIDTIPTSGCFMFISPVSGVKTPAAKTTNQIETIADKIIINSFFSVPNFSISGYIIAVVAAESVKPNV